MPQLRTPMLHVLVPGGSGQLGQDLAALARPGVEVSRPRSIELDLVDAGSVASAVDDLATRAGRSGGHAVVINAAAYTAVDAAETNVAHAHAVNATGAGTLAAVCATRGVPLVHVSTDYVFDGDGQRPYEPSDPRRPHSVYGQSKAAGEDVVLAGADRSWVVRTSWLYGAGRANFVTTMTRLERERETLSVVDDQRGSPTWTADLAAGLLELASVIADGLGPSQRVLHCTNAGDTTWYEFTRAIFTELGADPDRVRPCTTAQFPRPAPRPAYSVLSNNSWCAAGLTPLRPWQDALHEYFSHARAAMQRRP